MIDVAKIEMGGAVQEVELVSMVAVSVDGKPVQQDIQPCHADQDIVAFSHAASITPPAPNNVIRAWNLGRDGVCRLLLTGAGSILAIAARSTAELGSRAPHQSC